jgi:hypothetical protein
MHGHHGRTTRRDRGVFVGFGLPVDRRRNDLAGWLSG